MPSAHDGEIGDRDEAEAAAVGVALHAGDQRLRHRRRARRASAREPAGLGDLAGAVRSACCARIHSRSPPAQKLGPEAARTTTRTVGVGREGGPRPRSIRRSCRAFIAWCLSGRSSVTRGDAVGVGGDPDRLEASCARSSRCFEGGRDPFGHEGLGALERAEVEAGLPAAGGEHPHERHRRDVALRRPGHRGSRRGRRWRCRRYGARIGARLRHCRAPCRRCRGNARRVRAGIDRSRQVREHGGRRSRACRGRSCRRAPPRSSPSCEERLGDRRPRALRRRSGLRRGIRPRSDDIAANGMSRPRPRRRPAGGTARGFQRSRN